MIRLASILALLLLAVTAHAEPPPPGYRPPGIGRAAYSIDGKTIVAHFYQTPVSGIGMNMQFTRAIGAATGTTLATVPDGAHHYTGMLPAVRPGTTEVLFARPAADPKAYREKELVLWDHKTGKEVRT